MKNPPLTVNKITIQISNNPGLANRALKDWAQGKKNGPANFIFDEPCYIVQVEILTLFNGKKKKRISIKCLKCFF